VTSRRRIIIDTDPGHDDAFALLLAIASPQELEVLGITTVAGNVPLEKTTYNALRLRELAGSSEVPVFRGCERPLVNRLVTAEYVHGESGLDGPDLPPPICGVEAKHAVDYLVDTLRSSPDPLTVCLLGPMTNMAMAIIKAPEIAKNVDEFIIMGGSFHAGGNITPAAEFNVYVDPHAAHVVFESGVPLTIMPLDVTHQAQATRARTEHLRTMGTPVGSAVIEMLRFVERFDVAHGFDGFPLHDPTVIAYLLEPGMFRMRPGWVSVSLERGVAHGMTIADWLLRDGAKANADVALQIDADRYFELIAERLATL
jgi:purine nucleosidase